MSAENNESKSPHVLNASSNMLGICFLVLTSVKLLEKSAFSVIDEVTTVAIIFFMFSCLFSFLSIRRKNRTSERMENIADIIFLGGLSLLFVTTILFAFNVIT